MCQQVRLRSSLPFGRWEDRGLKQRSDLSKVTPANGRQSLKAALVQKTGSEKTCIAERPKPCAGSEALSLRDGAPGCACEGAGGRIRVKGGSRSSTQYFPEASKCLQGPGCKSSRRFSPARLGEVRAEASPALEVWTVFLGCWCQKGRYSSFNPPSKLGIAASLPQCKWGN